MAICCVSGENLVPKPADEVEAEQEGAAGGQSQGRRRQARWQQGEPLQPGVFGHGGQRGGRHDGGRRLEQLQQQLPRTAAAASAEFGDAAGGAATPRRPGGGPPPPPPPPPPTGSAPGVGGGPLPAIRRVTCGLVRRQFKPDLNTFLFS